MVCDDKQVIRAAEVRQIIIQGCLCFLSGDSAYPLKDILMTPLLTPRSAAERYYNRSHKRTRCLVERCLGVLKSRFRWVMNDLKSFAPGRYCLKIWNKANQRDLIAATSLVILIKLDSNSQFFSPCDLEIWWMTLRNNRAPLLYYATHCAPLQIHRWILTRFAVWKRSIRVKIGGFFSCLTLKICGSFGITFT